MKIGGTLPGMIQPTSQRLQNHELNKNNELNSIVLLLNGSMKKMY